MDEDLLACDRALREEGRRLLEDTGLEKLIQAYAPCSAVGSYAYGLMYGVTWTWPWTRRTSRSRISSPWAKA